MILGVYLFLVLSIPVGAYLVSQNQNPNVAAKKDVDRTITNLEPLTSTSSATQLKQAAEKQNTSSEQPSSTSSPTTAVAFGPTLNIKLILEGRPANNQAGKVFVGIADVQSTAPIKYLLSFTIDLPTTGEFDGLSLAGLTPEQTYNAIVKGPAQIATSSAFLMSPSVTQLNQGQSIILLTGDLNEDNVVNSADFAIAKAAFGANPSSSNWNENVDFNLDGVVNSLDIGLILKNFTKTGDSGVWVSPAPQGSATQSGGPVPSGTGYWLWVPNI